MDQGVLTDRERARPVPVLTCTRARRHQRQHQHIYLTIAAQNVCSRVTIVCAHVTMAVQVLTVGVYCYRMGKGQKASWKSRTIQSARGRLS